MSEQERVYCLRKGRVLIEAVAWFFMCCMYELEAAAGNAASKNRGVMRQMEEV